jgi:hypothetical protein
MLYVQRLVARGGGFRPVTVAAWPPDRLAKEVVRLTAETPQDELELLQLLYVELEPAIQSTFLDAAGVAHESGRMAEELEPPYADADAVRRAAAAVRAAHGDDGERYLRTLARYSRDGWPASRTWSPRLTGRRLTGRRRGPRQPRAQRRESLALVETRAPAR